MSVKIKVNYCKNFSDLVRVRVQKWEEKLQNLNKINYKD
mgnify:CR=1 FL=1